MVIFPWFALGDAICRVTASYRTIITNDDHSYMPNDVCIEMTLLLAILALSANWSSLAAPNRARAIADIEKKERENR